MGATRSLLVYLHFFLVYVVTDITEGLRGAQKLDLQLSLRHLCVL